MKRILLVDEQADQAGGSADVLEMHGYAVIPVPDGGSALAAVREGLPIDLVITECRLPDMDGLDLVTALRNCAPALPVIVVTAHESIETYLKAINLGVVEYINKPLRGRELGRIVETALSRDAGRGPLAVGW